MGRGALRPLVEVMFHRLFAEVFRLALHDFQGALGAFAYAGSNPVTENLTYKLGLAIHKLERTFCTSDDALAASRALLFVDLDDLPLHIVLLFIKYMLTIHRVQDAFLDLGQAFDIARCLKKKYDGFMELRDLLRKTDLFRGMSEDALARLLSKGRTRRFEQGDILFIEGLKGSEFFLVIEGDVRLYKTSPDGQEVSLRIIRPGEIFAEVVLFENTTYPVSSVALSPGSVFCIERSSFTGLLDEREFRNEFIALLMKKQRYLAERILYLTSYDVEERFFHFLMERYGKRDIYTVDMAKKDIASTIGTIPETLSRLILRLRNLGVLQWEGNTLKVKRDYLENFITEE